MTEYCPYPLVTDAAALDLATTPFSSALGSVVARHRRTPESRRATVFLHGAAGSWTTWTPVLLAAHSSGSAIAEPVVLDLPGWGEATLAPNTGVRTIDAVCELVRDALTGLGYTEWDLVGHSMGGFIAMHMAARWPGSVRSVGLVSVTAWSVIASVAHPVRRFGTLPGFVGLWQAMKLLAALGPGGPALVRALDRARVLRLAVSPLFRYPLRVHRSVVDALASEVRPAAFLCAAEIARDYDADSAWVGIACPVRAVRGDRDVFVRDDDHDRLLALLPHALVTTLRDCGHFANVERPHEVLELVVQ